jgi:hypothetical protein
LSLIERKTLGIFDAKTLRNYQKSYYNHFSDNIKLKWIIACDFETFRIYDKIFNLMAEFKREYSIKSQKYLGFLRIRRHDHSPMVDMGVAEMIGKLCDVLQIVGYVSHGLELSITRLIFSLFSENTGISWHNQFTNYIKSEKYVGSSLHSFFEALNG